MSKIARKAAVTLVATLMSAGLIGAVTAPAHADTTWGCSGHCKVRVP